MPLKIGYPLWIIHYPYNVIFDPQFKQMKIQEINHIDNVGRGSCMNYHVRWQDGSIIEMNSVEKLQRS